ncbi:MAG: hypothetical protein ACRD4D_08490 [Candidatus Acidiferrales bacterium]
MSRGATVRVPLALAPLLRSTRTLRQNLDSLRELLTILRKGSYAECVQAIDAVRTALRALETEESGRFYREEMKLCAALHSSNADFKTLMEELADDREAVRQAFAECRRALKAFNMHGDSGPLRQAADRLVNTLSLRLDRQQQELVPALERELQGRETPRPPDIRLADAS